MTQQTQRRVSQMFYIIDIIKSKATLTLDGMLPKGPNNGRSSASRGLG